MQQVVDVAGSTVPTVTVGVEGQKSRKPRGPRKSTVAALKAEYDKGYNAGINAPRDPWPGAMAALVLGGVAFVLGAVIF